MKTILWCKPECIYCDLAKDKLMASGIKFETRMLGNGWTKEQLLEDVPAAATVPQIFLYGEYVGGYDDLVKYYDEHNMNIGGGEI